MALKLRMGHINSTLTITETWHMFGSQLAAGQWNMVHSWRSSTFTFLTLQFASMAAHIFIGPTKRGDMDSVKQHTI